MMRKLGLLAANAFALSVLLGCQAIKPYEKQYLLDPLMDDATAARLDSQIMGNAKGRFERLSRGGGGSAGTSCPTCGG